MCMKCVLPKSMVFILTSLPLPVLPYLSPYLSPLLNIVVLIKRMIACKPHLFTLGMNAKMGTCRCMCMDTNMHA